MTERDVTHQYLNTLQRYLARLSADDANDVVQEIESHIFEALEASDNGDAPTRVEDILAGFGDPRTLASEYVSHILEGTPPPSGFRALQAVQKGVTRGLYYATAVFGYLVSLTLLVIALFKPFMPHKTGVWIGDSGESIVLGMLENPPANNDEVLGWWLVPLFLLVGVGIAYLTHRILAVLKTKLPRELAQ